MKAGLGKGRERAESREQGSTAITIRSEPSSGRTRGWSRHPALPRSVTDGSRTTGWSHSCLPRWGCPAERAHEAQLTLRCVFTPAAPRRRHEGQAAKPDTSLFSSSSFPHSVHQFKIKPWLNCGTALVQPSCRLCG